MSSRNYSCAKNKRKPCAIILQEKVPKYTADEMCSIYPFIEHNIAELNARCKPRESTIKEIQMLLPVKTSKDSGIEENLKKIAQTFLGRKNEVTIFLSKYEICHNRWKSIAQKPATVINAIDNWDDQFLPLIK